MGKLKSLSTKASLVAISLLFAALIAVPDVSAASSWQNVGSPGFSNGEANGAVSLGINSSNVLYAAYSDVSNGNKVTVKKFDGTSWVSVGSPNGFSDGYAEYPSLAFDSNDTPYVAYKDDSNGNKATVKKFDGNAWQTVGTADFSNGDNLGNNISIAFDSNDTPYVAYGDNLDTNNTHHKATVKKFDGNAWQTVGTAGFSAGDTHEVSIAIDSIDTPYVVYRDDANNEKVTVKKFDGNAWQTVGTAGFSTGRASTPSLVIGPKNTPYVAYTSDPNYHYSSSATVKKFDGTNWVSVGSPQFSTGMPDMHSLAFGSNGVPYLAYWGVNRGYGATVVKFDGNNWVNVGPANFSPGRAQTPSLVIDSSGTLYVAYLDGAHNDKASVMKYTDSDSQSGGSESGDKDGGSGGHKSTPPNGGDGNNDGRKDSGQKNVATVKNPADNKYVTVAVDSSCTLSDVSITKASKLSAQDNGYSYKSGMVNFNASGCSSDKTNVKIYYHGVSPSGLVARKYNPTTKQYSTVTSAKLTKLKAPLSGTLVSYTIKDNGPLDTNPAKGVIQDPVGLATSQAAAKVPNTGLKPVNMIIFAAAILVGAGLVISQIKLKTPRQKNEVDNRTQ